MKHKIQSSGVWNIANPSFVCVRISFCRWKHPRHAAYCIIYMFRRNTEYPSRPTNKTLRKS